MNNFLKVIIASFFSICFCYKTYAFDLKSLTDKIQKDIGNKLQVPKGVTVQEIAIHLVGC